MANRPGRDQRAPMERLVRIAAALRSSGDRGVPGVRLAEVAGFDTDGGGMDQLSRDIRHLTARGWQIENIAGPGEPSTYRMRAVDNRLRVRLSLPQLRALQRAVLVADRADLVQRLGLGEVGGGTEPGVVAGVPTSPHDGRLDAVLRAVRLRSVLHFGYKGRPRTVHPESVRTQNGTWYLRGQEDDDPEGPIKAFVVGRMGEVEVDEPGSARRVPAPRHTGLHPMTWEIDRPVDVTLRTTPDFEPDVRRWLGPPAGTDVDGKEVVMRYRVTHRAALRARLYELGRRVVLVGPEEVRRELIADLEERAAVGGSR